MGEPRRRRLVLQLGMEHQLSVFLQIREEGRTKVKTLTLTLMVQSRHHEESKHQVPVKGLSLDVEDDGGDKVHANQSLEVPGVPTRKERNYLWKYNIFKNVKVVGRKEYAKPDKTNLL